MTANAADAVWQKLDKDLKEYGDKVQLAKTRDGLSGSITKFGKQLEEAQARDKKLMTCCNHSWLKLMRFRIKIGMV